MRPLLPKRSVERPALKLCRDARLLWLADSGGVSRGQKERRTSVFEVSGQGMSLPWVESLVDTRDPTGPRAVQPADALACGHARLHATYKPARACGVMGSHTCTQAHASHSHTHRHAHSRPKARTLASAQARAHEGTGVPAQSGSMHSGTRAGRPAARTAHRHTWFMQIMPRRWCLLPAGSEVPAEGEHIYTYVCTHA